MTVLLVVLSLVLAVHCIEAQTFTPINTKGVRLGGYLFGVDVTPYRGMSIDCHQIGIALKAKNFPAANTIYTNGRNYVRPTGPRSLKSISDTARPGEAYYGKMAAVYGAPRFAERALWKGAAAITAALGAEKVIVACQWISLGFIGHELDVAKRVLATDAALAAEEIDDAFGIYFGYPAASSLWAHASQVEKWIPCAGNNLNSRIVASVTAMKAAATAKNQALYDAQYNAFFNRLTVAMYLRSALYAGTRRNPSWQKYAASYLQVIVPFLRAPQAKTLSALLSSPALANPVIVRALVQSIATQQGIGARDAGVC